MTSEDPISTETKTLEDSRANLSDTTAPDILNPQTLDAPANSESQLSRETMSTTDQDSEKIPERRIDGGENRVEKTDGDNGVRESMNTTSTLEAENGEPKEDEKKLEEAPKPSVLDIHSVFSRREKQFIVCLAALAGLFSPISASIYFPALDTLSSTLHVSYALINLTITTYLIMQGLSPTFIGTYSEDVGRRPAYVLCFIIYIGANIGLALQTNYAALLVLRMVQSAGSSGTISLANAIVADIGTSAERGRYISYVQSGALLGPAFGPVIGGLLVQYLGWRSVFWFLTIFSGVTLIFIIIFFPETCRNVVGNGSIAPQSWNTSLISKRHIHRLRKTGESFPARDVKYNRFPNPIASLRIIFDKESGILLLFGGIIVAGFQMVAASLSEQLQTRYSFNSLQIGLCYIPLGFGALVCSLTMGRVIDWNFKRLANIHGLDISKGRQQDLTKFPIELARAQIALPGIILCAASVVTYGWVMEYKTNLAGPLIMLFIMGFFLSVASNALATLVIDLNLSSPATATAAYNLIRCWLSAASVAIVSPLNAAIGIGWTSTLVAAIIVLETPVLLWVIKKGPQWRRERKAKMDKKKEEKEVKRKVEDPESSAKVVDDKGDAMNILRAEKEAEKQAEQSENNDQE